jgi:hypothetical protein
MANMITTAPHLTFDEQADREPQGFGGPATAGSRDLGDHRSRSWTMSSTAEYRDGNQVAFEELYDL